MASTVPTLGGMAPAPLVQLTGSLLREDLSVTSTEIVRDIGRLTGGRVTCFYAPFLLPDEETARTLRRQPEIARAISQFRAVTRAVVGLGAWGPGQSTIYDAMSTADRRALTKAGAVADVSGVFLDASGRVVGHEQTARMICMSAEQLADVERRPGDPLRRHQGARRARRRPERPGHQPGHPRRHGADAARRLGGRRLARRNAG